MWIVQSRLHVVIVFGSNGTSLLYKWITNQLFTQGKKNQERGIWNSTLYFETYQKREGTSIISNVPWIDIVQYNYKYKKSSTDTIEIPIWKPPELREGNRGTIIPPGAEPHIGSLTAKACLPSQSQYQ